MDPAKKDWDALCADVAQLKTGSQMLNQSVANLDEFRKKAEPNMWFVVYLRWILGVLLAVTGVTVWSQGLSHLERFHALEASAKSHQEWLGKLEDQVKDQTKRLTHLREHIVVLFDRQPKGMPLGAEAVVYRGEAREITANSITILPPETDEPMQKFILGPEAVIKVGGVAAKLEDLQIGWHVEIFRGGGQVVSIDAERP